jgi:glycosyltransferase involved in cell wall biosynthesis
MSEAAPLVTIVIPCHNYGRFLSEAVESALAQTYPEVEIVVIDDGSIDDSLEVARRYADRVRVLSQENAGMERTCNRGVEEASGEYVVILSADDRIEPAYVEQLHAALAATPDASYAYSSARLFGSEDRLARSRPFSAFLLARGPNYVNGSALVRRSDYLEVGGYSELGEIAYEDWDLWLKLAGRGRRGTYVARPLLHWRRHGNGSRNPEERAAIGRSEAAVRARHPELLAAATGVRGSLNALLDRLAVAADGLLGIARHRRLLRLVERRSWRSFRRRLGAVRPAP